MSPDLTPTKKKRISRAHYRCVGVGAGPSNLSLAALLHGHTDLPNLFIDRKPEFSWHDGQQLKNTTLQVSFLKDLVSLADPTNRFSFLSYLHEQGKIYHFLNAQFEAVPRIEFRNYLRWAADRNNNVVFGETIEAVEFDRLFIVHTDRRTVTADHLSLGLGTRPWLPECARELPKQNHYHVSEILHHASELAGRRVCVVGGGQSGAEAFLDLISRHDDSRPRRVSWVTRRGNFLPIDDSPFTNDLFTPSYSDHHFSLHPREQAAFNNRQLLSSDGISESTLRQIYQSIYAHRFIGGKVDLVGLYPNHTVLGVCPTSTGSWDIELASGWRPGETSFLDADVIVWATGYRPNSLEILAPIAHRLSKNEHGLTIDRDFAVEWDGPSDHCLFVQNGAEKQRGLADRNLSLIAWRSQRIVDRIRGVRSDEQLASFIEWDAKPLSLASNDTLFP